MGKPVTIASLPANRIDSEREYQLGADLPAYGSVLLTSVKILCIPLIYLAVSRGHLWLLAVLVGVAMVSDILDGVVFSFSHLASSADLKRRRRIVDSTTDRFLIGSTLLTLLLFTNVPQVFIALAFAREFVLSVVSCYPYVTRGVVLNPNLLSRIATILLGIQVIVFGLGAEVSATLVSIFLLFAIGGIAQFIRQQHGLSADLH